MVKVFDCFPFFNELEILDIRLHELDRVVDYFVICEAAFTFTGAPKEKVFLNNLEGRYAKYKDKIIYLSIDEFPAGYNQWTRDIFQREFLKTGLETADDDDLIIISDVDEIPRVSAVERALAFDGVTQFSMNMYQYFVNMLEREDWCCSSAMQKKYLQKLDVSGEHDSLSVSRYHMAKMTAEAEVPYQVIKDAGWHFTHMGGLEKLKAKFAAYAHAEDYWPRLMRDDERLQQQIDLGVKIWSAEVLTKYVPVDETYPSYVVENQESFLKGGYIKDIYKAHEALQMMYLTLKRALSFSNLGNRRSLPLLGNMNADEYLKFANVKDIDPIYLSLPEPVGSLISEGKIATQSSRSEWSRGTTPEDDATEALNGPPTGGFSFHTELEMAPWWMVDLATEQTITEIRVFNRIFPFDNGTGHVRRIDSLQMSVSSDGETFKLIYFHDSAGYIGGVDGRPLIFHPKKTLKARYLKLHLSEERIFHLDKVYVYGEP